MEVKLRSAGHQRGAMEVRRRGDTQRLTDERGVLSDVRAYGRAIRVSVRDLIIYYSLCCRRPPAAPTNGRTRARISCY